MTDSAALPTLEFQQQGDCLVATILEGQLRDQLVVNRVREEFLNQVASTPAKDIVLDFGNVSFVGSVAFMAFLAMRRAPGVEQVLLCNVDPNVKSVFEVCKLIPTAQRAEAPFKLAGSLSDAMNAAGGL